MEEASLLLTSTGLGVIGVTVALLIWGKVHPTVPLAVVPVLGALIAGFSFAQVTEFFSSGLEQVIEVAIMLIFAIMFFGVIIDSGLFNPLIRGLILATRGKVVLVAVGTSLIAIVAHVDGAGASTFLLTIPALLPLYQALNMSPYLLLLLVVMSASIFNMIPWGGPLGRAASVVDAGIIELYQPLIAVQIASVFLIMGAAVFFGFREKHRIQRLVTAGQIEAREDISIREVADDFSATRRAERELLGEDLRSNWAVTLGNLAVLLTVVFVMMADIVPPALAFILGLAVVLPLNCRTAGAQMDRVKAHAPAALMTTSILFAASIFLGVLNETGMLESIATSALLVIPDSVGPHLHLIVGFLVVPLDLLTSTDAYYFSLLPLVDATAGQFGVESTATAHSMLIGNVTGTYVSPFAAGTWLAVGLAGAQMGKHIRYSFFPLWIMSILLILVAVAFGVITF
ncbi:CitMHS family transporter [Nesterenkonia aerolata]|uniref:SLC13 family permease n=1 Tax=Nesterenkonia aerolata TaxID=3074079 RepID=A0ABU2DND1_9MICC|nr:SLC13 family permease [Nesterenkonia sp. LY-0111]MDR8018005.1 SLC13 family permease [Nesterenkonia sp. LY-0111]